MHNFKQLRIWNLSMNLAAEMYKTTEGFPRSEIYGITNQIRKSAVSIPSNIAEGAGRVSNREFIRFLYYSYGSASELETQVILSNRLGFLEKHATESISETIDEIQRKIYKLIEKYEDAEKNNNV